MANKQLIKMNAFEGGINNSADARDITSTQLADITDASIASLGKIVLLGGFTEHESTLNGVTGEHTLTNDMPDAGYGLFGFRSDYKIINTSNGAILSPSETSYSNYFSVFQNSDDDAEVTFFQKNGTDKTWLADTNEKSLGSTHANVKLNTYAHEGAIRVSDGGAGNNDVKRMGVITPKFYGFGPATTYYLGGSERTGSASTYTFNDDTAVPVGCFLTDTNDDGDASCQNAIMANYDYSDIMPQGLAAEVNCALDGLDLDAAIGGSGATGELKWGCILLFTEGTMNSGTWMPSHNTSIEYKFWISTMYDNQTQESLPQLFSHYPSSDLDTNDDYIGAKAHSSIQFTNGTAHDTQGQNVRLHLLPVFKFTGATYSDSSTGSYAFGASTSTSTSGGDPRISGARIYWSSSEDGHSDLWQIFDCDFAKGVKSYGQDGAGGSSSWGTWRPLSLNYDSASGSTKYGGGTGAIGYRHYNHPQWTGSNRWLHPPRFVNYYNNNFHSHEDVVKVNSFKTSVVINQRAYIGNVNQTIDDVATQFSDRILFSPIGQYDKFPENNILDTAINDGDEIIHLASFADRLLQFKSNVLYIINVAQEETFVESVHRFKGVEHSAAVCETEDGIAWANTNGAYLYDGAQVVDLLSIQGQQLIKVGDSTESGTWQNFINTPMVGYSPKTKELIFADDVGTDGDGAIHVFNMITKSWVKGANSSIDDAIKSNFITDYNNDLIYYDFTNARMMKWVNTPETSSSLSVVTKDFDFDAPGVKKRVYKVYLSYRGDASNVTVQYGVNGATPSSNFYPITSGTDGSSTSTGATAKCIPYNAGTDDWLTAELKPGASVNNINSFQIKVGADGAVASDFEINDISIVFRLKRVK